MANERTIRLNRLVLWLLPVVFVGAAGVAALSAARAAQAESQLDARLQQIIAIYNLRPLQIREYSADPEMRLGQALFFDPVVSGNRDVSCSSCHLLSYGLTDGLPRSIGVGGLGIGPGRHLLHGLSIHPRRSLDLWNRDNNAVSSFFWDGHVEVLDSRRRIFRSPMGTALPPGFQNAMAVQSVVPLTVPDEMLGAYRSYSSSALPEPHRNQINDLVTQRSYPSVASMMQSVYRQLLKRLLGLDAKPHPWQNKYRQMFAQAYPQKRMSQISIVDIGNAIAHFEEMGFAANAAPWDDYLGGDTSAISREAKVGAILFYGRARCAVCHAGPMFSDFQYHSVGIFSKITVNGKLVNDYGRWMVTGNERDRYRFRTPPLRNVTGRPLLFHDGSSSSLSQAILRHVNPLARAGGYMPDGSFAMDRGQIESVSPLLTEKIALTDDDVEALIAFLGTLASQSRDKSQIIPQRVPSGISFTR
jgi:cytochrome c peroxidase